MRFFKLIILIIIVLSITSCTTMTRTKVERDKDVEEAVGKVVRDTIEAPLTWAAEVSEQKGVYVPTEWLESFNDPMLLLLVEEGRANNIDLQVAVGNMDKAWLLVRRSGAVLQPTADLFLDGVQASSPPESNLIVGLQVSWELDVWGRIRSGVHEAQAHAQVAEADYIFLQHSLAANIAKTYFKIIEAKLQADIAYKNLAILEQTMDITQTKFDAGLSSAQDIAINLANLAFAKDILINIEGKKNDAIRALEVLLGRYPNAELEIGSVLPDLPPPPSAGIPSAILERRPDIVSAERQIAAAFDVTDQAQAARLPRFALTGSISGFTNPSSLQDPDNFVWQVAANLMTPLFDGGMRKIDVEIATVEQQQAILNYAQTTLSAFSEVENNLDQGRVLAGRATALKKAYVQSNIAYRIASLRYREGESDLLDTLRVQQQVIFAESDLLSVQRSQLEQRINLHLSLGGSW